MNGDHPAYATFSNPSSLLCSQPEKKNDFIKLPKKAREGDFSAALRMMRTINDRKANQGNLKFVQACALAGCDYLPSLPSVGLVTSFKMAATKALRPWVYEVCKKVELKGSEKGEKVDVPDPKEYWGDFEKAVRVFYHHRVYRTKTQSVEMISAAPVDGVGEVGDELGEFNRDIGMLGNYVGVLEPSSWVGCGGLAEESKDGWMKKNSDPNPNNSDRGAFSSSFNLDDAEGVSTPLPVPKRLQKARGNNEMDKYRMKAGRRVTLESSTSEEDDSKSRSSFFKPSKAEKGRSLFSQDMDDEVLNEPELDAKVEKKKRGPLDIFRMSEGGNEKNERKPAKKVS